VGYRVRMGGQGLSGYAWFAAKMTIEVEQREFALRSSIHSFDPASAQVFSSRTGLSCQ
jgi:hypothetical protein